MYENILLNNVRREAFYVIIKKLDVDLELIFPAGEKNDDNKKNKDHILLFNNDIRMKEQFNNLIKRLKRRYFFDVLESIMFIEQDYASIRLIFNLMDEDCRSILKRELGRKYGIKVSTTRLHEFIEGLNNK